MTLTTARVRGGDIVALLPLCAIYFLASTFILALPMWVGAVIDARIADATVAGWLATLELGTVAVSMLLASHRQAFGSVKVHAGFAALAIAAYAGSAFASSVMVLALLRVVAGAGFGWTLAATLAAAARRDNPTRTFGIMEIALALYATAFYSLVGSRFQADGMRGGFLTMACALLICAPAVAALRASPKAAAPHEAGPKAPAGRPGFRVADWAGILAHFLFFVAMYSVWTFLSLKGGTVGIDAAGLGHLLSAAFIAGLVGAALTMVLIPLFGRRIVIPGGLACLAGVMLLLGHAGTAFLFESAVIAIKLGFLFYTVSMSGQFASADPSGRLNTIGLAMAMIGSSVGPTVGGYGLKTLGFEGLAMAAAAMWIFVALLTVIATRKKALSAA